MHLKLHRLPSNYQRYWLAWQLKFLDCRWRAERLEWQNTPSYWRGQTQKRKLKTNCKLFRILQLLRLHQPPYLLLVQLTYSYKSTRIIICNHICFVTTTTYCVWNTATSHTHLQQCGRLILQFFSTAFCCLLAKYLPFWLNSGTVPLMTAL